MAIIEVTNNGIPENMEMLIHLKVSTGACVWLYLQRCACFCVERCEAVKCVSMVAVCTAVFTLTAATPNQVLGLLYYGSSSAYLC